MIMRTIKNIVLSVTFIVLVGLVSCKQSNNEQTNTSMEYFRHMLFSETPYDQYRGTYPLTAEQARRSA